MGCCDEAKNYERVERSAPIAAHFPLPTTVHAQYKVDGHPLSALGLSLNKADIPGATYPCPEIHKDGSIEYPKGESDPPPDIDGYQRCEDNPWKFLPLWSPCKLRFQGTKRAKSGAIDIAMLCQNPDHTKYGQFAKFADCESCPLRKGE